jgi:putative addiction module CopG family antidote
MQILLEKPELERFIRNQVDCGQYSSPVEVVEAALSQFMFREFAPGELQRLVDEGEASIAEHGLLNADDVFRNLEEKSRLARLRASK